MNRSVLLNSNFLAKSRGMGTFLSFGICFITLITILLVSMWIRLFYIVISLLTILAITTQCS